MQTQCPPPSREVTACFMLVLVSWGWASLGWVRDAGLRTYCEPAVSLLLEQFLQPLPSLDCRAEAFVWFFFFFPTKGIYSVHNWRANVWACNYSLPGSFRDRWPSLIFIFFQVSRLTCRSESPTTWATVLLSCPLASATPSKLSHCWKLPSFSFAK